MIKMAPLVECSFNHEAVHHSIIPPTFTGESSNHFVQKSFISAKPDYKTSPVGAQVASSDPRSSVSLILAARTKMEMLISVLSQCL